MENSKLYNDTLVKDVRGNKPLLLNTDEKVWIVDTGKIDVFFYAVDQEGTKKKRNFWQEVNVGDVLLGIPTQGIKDSENHNTYHLIAVGIGDATVKEINKDEWITALTAEMEDTELDYMEALQKAIQGQKEDTIKEIEITKKRTEKNDWFMSEGIKSLGSVMGEVSTNKQIMDQSMALLLQASIYVGKAMKIEIQAPNVDKNEMTMEQIARVSRIRTREVILKGQWWKGDNGPLVAYMEDDGRPVALIPKSPTEYELIDCKNNTVISINKKIAESINPMAICFYRSFGSKVLDKMDLLAFALGRCWKRDLILVATVGLLGGLLGLVTPIATGILFESIIPEGEKLLMIQLGFFLAAVGVSNVVFESTRAFASLRIEGKAEIDIQSGVWDRLLSLPVPFFKDYTAGELAMRAMGINQIRSILSGAAMSTVLSGIFSLCYLGLLFYYSAKLALVALAIVAVMITISITMGIMQLKYERQLVDARDKMTGFVLQLFSGISKFKMAGAEKRAFFQWSKKYAKVQKLTFKSETIGTFLATINASTMTLAYIAIYFAFYKLADDKLTPGKFIAFQSSFVSFLGASLSVSSVFLQINNIIPLYERAKPILETLPEYDEFKKDIGQLQGNIEVNNIDFRYKADSPLVLEDVSLSIKEGDYVAIVGSSGSGKSTLLRLLLGFEKAEKGKVYYDGQDMDKVDIRSIRKQLGVVLQNGQLMAGDIFSNIVGANSSLTIKDAQEAIKMAGMEDDIAAMPMGLHSVISEGATTISGGQRQRLLIARAIVNKPNILYFDEATSALDNRTQSIVSESLGRMNSTRVVIAHRLSTILACNHIIVMDQGRIVEQGNYDELMSLEGLFFDLAKRQLA